ncbi:MAG: hypothetical protein LBM26_04080 [Methanobrevibacter sp.]|jgi:hypothetical protein|nr:hypothetical protein [Methanobrevibacter sp.]
MLKIAILTDGPYGDRAYQIIKKEFDTEFIHLKAPSDKFFDEKIEIPKEAIEKIEEANIIISYISHIDLVLDIVDKFSDKVDWIIIASWRGEGLKNQLESKGNVTCSYIMCELEDNGNPIYDEFVSKFGKPILEFILNDNNEIENIEVIRSSPCGSTSFVADFIANKYKNQNINKIAIDDLAREAGLRIQHYPCRAGKIRLFSDEESKKQLASTFHSDAFKSAKVQKHKNKNRKIKE